jgi:hypothetical protein
LEEDLLREIDEYRVSRIVLGGINATFITLIPKKNSLDTFDDCMLISL